MALRFFADHCISNFIIQSLASFGHEVFRLRECIPVESPDSVVIAKARELDAILVSLDGDFADIITYPPAHFNGIIALQLRNHPELEHTLLSRVKAHTLGHPAMEDYRGKLIVVEVDRIRVRE